jgi:cell division protease FtsH
MPEKKSTNKWINWNSFFTSILILFVLFFVLRSLFARTQEISFNYFKNELLLKQKVARIDVLNKQKVYVFLNQTPPDNKGLIHKVPTYYFEIGSIDFFEQELKQLQSNFPESKKIIQTYSNETNEWTEIAGWLVPLLVIYFFWTFWKRVNNANKLGNWGIFDFSKAKPNEFNFQNNKLKITFKDVAGYDEAKQEIIEVIQFLKTPEKYKSLGAKIPKGILLLGPPGTGKTHLAKAVAGEANVPFFSLSGSEFVELFVGVGAARVRDLFLKAKEKAPSIVFIDEIDSIGRVRSAAASFHVNDERESTLNQLLSEMDGFDENTNVIVIAASNRPDILDVALLRPGRFDRHIYLDLPNLKEREAIFKVHSQGLLIDSTIKLDELALLTPGFSGADIANMCNEAALIAARNKKTKIDLLDFQESLERIVIGPEKKSKIITNFEKKIIATHESGHAIVANRLKQMNRINKISIIPRGKSLGTTFIQFQEQDIFTQSQLNDLICILLSGKASEEVIFNECSSGSVDDLEKATQQAYQMVMNFGLNKEIGSLSFNKILQNQTNFLKPFSDSTATLIDIEVRKIIKYEYERAILILNEEKQLLQFLSYELLSKEIIKRDELIKLLNQRNITD